MSSDAVHFSYYSPKLIASSFEEVEDDSLIQAPENLQCQWFHSPYDSDLIVWRDNNGIFVRIHFCFSGLTLDWDLMNGTQSGYIVEQNGENLTHSIFGEICYDKQLSAQTRDGLVAIVEEISIIETGMRKKIIEYFEKSPSYEGVVADQNKDAHYWRDFIGMLRNFFAK